MLGCTEVSQGSSAAILPSLSRRHPKTHPPKSKFGWGVVSLSSSRDGVVSEGVFAESLRKYCGKFAARASFFPAFSGFPKHSSNRPEKGAKGREGVKKALRWSLRELPLRAVGLVAPNLTSKIFSEPQEGPLEGPFFSVLGVIFFLGEDWVAQMHSETLLSRTTLHAQSRTLAQVCLRKCSDPNPGTLSGGLIGMGPCMPEWI